MAATRKCLHAIVDGISRQQRCFRHALDLVLLQPVYRITSSSVMMPLLPAATVAVYTITYGILYIRHKLHGCMDQIAVIKLVGHSDSVLCLSASQQGGLLASGSEVRAKLSLANQQPLLLTHRCS